MEFNGKRNERIIVNTKERKKSPYAGLNRDITNRRVRKTETDLLDIEQPISFVAKDDERKISMIRQLTNWLITKDWSILSFDDEPGQSYEAILISDMSDFARESWLWFGTLRFVARATLGQTHNLTIQTQPTPATITGQEKTPWKIRTVFEVPQERFTLETSNGLYILLNYNFIAGDVLEVDYLSRSATLNGKNLDTAISIKSVFKELEPGQIEFVASHKSTVSYTERYY